MLNACQTAWIQMKCRDTWCVGLILAISIAGKGLEIKLQFLSFKLKWCRPYIQNANNYVLIDPRQSLWGDNTIQIFQDDSKEWFHHAGWYKPIHSFNLVAPELQMRCVKWTSIDSTCVISSPNPMFDCLLESSRWDDSNKWSNIEFGEEMVKKWTL